MNGSSSTGTPTANPTLTANSTLLALRPKEAAKALGIGQRMLWQMTQPRGPIPCVRVGCCVLYPRTLLEAWLTTQASKEGGMDNLGLTDDGGTRPPTPGGHPVAARVAAPLGTTPTIDARASAETPDPQGGAA